MCKEPEQHRHMATTTQHVLHSDVSDNDRWHVRKITTELENPYHGDATVLMCLCDASVNKSITLHHIKAAHVITYTRCALV